MDDVAFAAVRTAFASFLADGASIYVTGSFADESAAAVSDIDMVLVWDSRPESAAAVDAIRRSLTYSFDRKLDLLIVPRTELSADHMGWLSSTDEDLAFRHFWRQNCESGAVE